MPLSIYSNAASADAQIRLGKTQEMTANTMSKLASGLRIASVSDDPAGLGVSMVFDTQVRSYSQASRNTNDGLSLLQTTDGALSQVHGALQRMRELAVNSANGTLNNTDRVNLQTEFSQLQSEIDRIATSTRFGNISLLAAKQTVTLQVGINNTNADKIDVVIDTSTTTNLKVDTLKVDAQNSSQNALDPLDTAIATVSAARAQLGAMQNRLRVANDNNQAFSKNLSAAVGRIRDVDVAEATADLARSQVLTQAGIAVLSQANQAPNQALSLLR
mgnify:CR=1 FL=1